MKRLSLLALAPLAAFAGCAGGNASPTPIHDGVRPCRHYHYVVGADGRRHRQPCPAPSPHPTPAPAPGPVPAPPSPTSGQSLGPAPGPTVTAASNPACGTERWAVKTLQDANAQHVNAIPQATSLADLSILAGQESAAVAGRSGGVESRVWEVNVSLVEAKAESDSDVHLVVADGAQTAVVEFPAASCITGANKPAQNAINAARSALLAACPGISAGGFTHLSGNAVIEGVGFMDRDHGQTGRDLLPNGADLELHPALAFSTSGCVSANGASGAAHVPGGQPVAAQQPGRD